MKPKQIAVLILLAGSVIIPIGIIFLLLEAMMDGYNGSVLKGLLKELE